MQFNISTYIWETNKGKESSALLRVLTALFASAIFFPTPTLAKDNYKGQLNPSQQQEVTTKQNKIEVNQSVVSKVQREFGALFRIKAYKNGICIGGLGAYNHLSKWLDNKTVSYHDDTDRQLVIAVGRITRISSNGGYDFVVIPYDNTNKEEISEIGTECQNVPKVERWNI